MPDWWSVGIVIYEMMCKRKPFEVPALPQGDDIGRKELRRRTLEDTIQWDQNASGYSANLKDLVMKLLNRDPNARLGSNGDSEEILSHKVFTTAFKAKVEAG